MSVQTPVRVAVAVVALEGWYLVGTRAEGDPLAGRWEFPGGKLLPGESPQAAAVRECREETGLDVVAERILLQVRHQYDFGPLELHFVACRLAATPRCSGPEELTSSQPPLAPSWPRPIPPFRWLPRAALEAERFPAANRSLIALLSAE